MKEDLIGGASLENRQVFQTAPTLGELQYFLSVVCDELTVYKAWPVCCTLLWTLNVFLSVSLGELLFLLFLNPRTSRGGG